MIHLNFGDFIDMKLDIMEYTTWIEYYNLDYDYHIIVDKAEDKAYSTLRCSDNFYDMNIEFLKEVMKDYDSNDYKYGKFLNEHE